MGPVRAGGAADGVSSDTRSVILLENTGAGNGSDMKLGLSVGGRRWLRQL